MGSWQQWDVATVHMVSFKVPIAWADGCSFAVECAITLFSAVPVSRIGKCLFESDDIFLMCGDQT